ncbi:sugar ABC transporter substrate-binding protein [Streptomyces mangrovisoli]|uniref:Sugar ABC transporter substrate-binding protein n=1 Tax=Streptomyces mangrovisoli TaxID=1428628 RepID=A0A1J4NQR4_9ACTN|nr:sugar ABC transporter substrate-binding protein [Streptomyces mangrovisoli]OIJ64659.1 sugar ABC transporter substrate-binding protein [Streptomyces mangrovisoli]
MPSTACRRRIVLVPLLGSSLLLSGCGLTDSTADSSGSGHLTIGFVNGGSTEFHTCLQKSMEETASSNLVSLVTANSHQDADDELSNIQDMIDRRVSAIILQTVDTQALKKDIAEAKAAHIPLFLTSVSADPSDILGAVVVDLKQVGKLDAQWINDDAGGATVEAGVIAGAPGAASDLLVGGFTKALEANVHVVANKPGMFDAAKAKAVAASMIAAHPSLEYVFVANEEMAFAARKAFVAAGAPGVKIVSVNGTDAALAALKDGRFAATVSNSAADTGQLAIENTIALLRKQKGAHKIANTPIRLVTKANADTAPMYCPTE